MEYYSLQNLFEMKPGNRDSEEKDLLHGNVEVVYSDGKFIILQIRSRIYSGSWCLVGRKNYLVLSMK